MLGTCDRAYVGCIIVRDGRAVSWGFNGAPPGLPHCDENMHGYIDLYPWPDAGASQKEMGKVGPLAQEWAEDQVKEHGCRNATHAEANALAFAARQGISTEGGTCYVKVCPCEVCARLLIAAGIARVVWMDDYRDPAGRELLERAGLSEVS